MNKKSIITFLLALVAVMGRAIDEYQFHSGTAVLRGRILNKPTGEWDNLSVVAFNLFTDEEQVLAIPVAADGSFEASIHLPHSQSVLVRDIANVFLAVGDTLELTKDAAQVEDEAGVTFGGHGASTDINRLWPEVKRHYFGDRTLYTKGMPMEDATAWKQEMVRLMDAIHADIEADRLPLGAQSSRLPAATSAYVKEVLGASLMAMPFYATIENYCDNLFMKGGVMKDYYDFLTSREEWLLDNPAMLFVIDKPDYFINSFAFYVMPDIGFMAGRFRLSCWNDEPADVIAYKQEMLLPREFDADLHRRLLSLRADTLLTCADYYASAMQATQERYGLRNVDFIQQMVLCRDVFDDVLPDKDFTPYHAAAKLAAAFSLISNPIVAHHALERYRQYVISEKGKAAITVSATPEADAIFRRIIEPYKGNALFVHFWGMGCGPCRREMLEEREKVERLKDQPVRFLYICDEKDSPRERSEPWLTQNNIKGEHIYLTHNEWNLLSAKFNIYAIPFTIGVDKDGNVVTYDAVNNYVQDLQK